ncbi:tandem-95 repeat protein [Corallincola holothuriorum]|uniref:Tandem-95 repeat protein n=1 Tax=Corallincola holothuriorum TaxID=2282215 RepID=A0A368NP86_9GAMM|nr:Ig-like domain-containing protein [Corallincola holothuriorum]RCU51675.1 tandem-95 repeat protein [Corallincola holothuriorum]
MKYLKQGLLLSAVLSTSLVTTHIANALSPAEEEPRPLTLIEKSVWGSASYSRVQAIEGNIYTGSQSTIDVLAYSDTNEFTLVDQLTTAAHGVDWLLNEANSEYVFRLQSNDSAGITLATYTQSDLADGDDEQLALDTYAITQTLSKSGAIIKDGYIYFNAGDNGLYIFDVRDPLNIEQVNLAAIVEFNDQMVVSGNTLYIFPEYTDGNSTLVTTYDISDKQRLVKTDEITVEGISFAREYTTDENNLYLSTYNKLFAIHFDDHDVDLIATDYSEVYYLTAANGYLYRGTNHYTGLIEVYDTQSGTPVHVTTIPGTQSFASDAVIADNNLYIATETGVYTYDLTDPEQPSAIGSFSQSGRVGKVIKQDDSLLLAHDRGGLKSLPLTEDMKIDDTAVDFINTEAAYTVVTEGNLVYTANENGKMESWDATNPTSLVLISDVQTIGSGVLQSLIDGDDLILGTNGGITLIDKSASGLMQNVRSIQLQIIDNSNAYIYDMLLHEEILYLATTVGLQLVDLNDKQAPTLIGIVNPTGEITQDRDNTYSDAVRGLTIQNGKLYSAGSGVYEGVLEWDISIPGSPKSTLAYPDHFGVYSLASFEDSFLLTLNGNGEIEVFELDNLAGDPVTTLQTTAYEYDAGLTLFDNMLVADSAGGGQVTTIEINKAPTIVESTLQATEDTVLNGSFSVENEVDEEVSFELYGSAVEGVFSVDESGDYQFTPAANSTTAGLVTVQVVDVHGGSSLKQIAIEVAAVNDAPIVEDESASTIQGRPVSGQFVASDIEGSVLSYDVTLQPAQGVLTVNAQGSYTYTPNTTAVIGVDSAEVTVTDAEGAASIITLAIQVNLNTPPTVENAATNTIQGRSVSGTLTASDVEGSTLSYEVTTQPLQGTLTVNTQGSYDYTPNDATFVGSDTAEVTVTDTEGASSVVEVTIQVVENTPPSIAPVSASGTQDKPLTYTITASDADTDTLTYSVSRPPANGTVVLNQDGSFTYQPNEDYVGTDSFEVTVTDPNGAEAKADVSVDLAEASSGGGGGSFGLITLIALALLGWRRRLAA